MRPARIPVGCVGALALSLFVASCAGPARTATDYRLKARTTARAALSVVATSEIVATIVRKDNAFPPYVSVSLDDAERDLDGAESTFSSVQPPDQPSDQLRDKVTSALDDASDVVYAMRISARRDSPEELLHAASDLSKVKAELEPFESISA